MTAEEIAAGLSEEERRELKTMFDIGGPVPYVREAIHHHGLVQPEAYPDDGYYTPLGRGGPKKVYRAGLVLTDLGRRVAAVVEERKP
jgi:hypothetical protein